jgi:hypothetical protein
MTRPKMIMTNKHFAKVVDQAKELGAKTISILGFGESLIDKDTIWKVQYCSNLGLETFITTNASLLDIDTAFGLISAGLSHIRFSCHGIEQNYDKVHKPLKWDKVSRNISNFLAMNRIKFNSSTIVSVSVIPMHNESVYGIRQFWEKRVDYLEIWRPHNWVDTLPYREGRKSRKTCFRPFNGPLQINADGMVMICCFDFDGEMVVGCTHSQTLEEIIKGTPFRNIRERHTRSDFEGLPCESCDQLFEYAEDEHPLLYSNRDKQRRIGVTSSTKFALCEECN